MRVYSASGVHSAHALFSQKNTTGRFQSAARFIASWTKPMLVAPSPKLTSTTRGSSCSAAASASPLAIGGPAPTMPVVHMIPDSGWLTPMAPALPFDSPVAFPISSAKYGPRSTPVADHVGESAVGSDHLVARRERDRRSAAIAS